MSPQLSGTFHLLLLLLLLLVKKDGSEEIREPRERASLVDYSIKSPEKAVKGKIDLKTLMPKIPKHIQVYIAVAFSERDFPSYSKIFNKTLSSIPNSFLIPDSLNRHYNVSLSPLFFVLPNSGRFSSSIFEVMCSSFDKKRVVAILVIGESPAAFTVSLAATTSNIPVLWARGGMPNPPGNLQQHDPLEIRLEPSEVQLLEAVRGVFLATHWHSFTVMASPSLASRCASILDHPPLNPKVVSITQNPHHIFRKLADVSRSTRGVVLLLCDLSDAILVMNVAKKLSMIDGHFVWIWIDTTTKPASFLSLPPSPNQNLTQKYTRYLKKTSEQRPKSDEEEEYQRDGARAALIGRTLDRGAEDQNKRESGTANHDTQTSVPALKPFEKARKRRDAVQRMADTTKLLESAKAKAGTATAANREDGKAAARVAAFTPQNAPFSDDKVSGKLSSGDRHTWNKFTSMDYLSDFAVQLDYPADRKDSDDEVSVPVSRTWGKITEHFPVRSSGRGPDENVLRGSSLPVGLLSVKPEPMRVDRHLLKGSVRLLVSSLHTVLKKRADWLSILDADSSCWTKPSSMNKNFSETYAREIRQAVGESLSGQSQYQDGDRADRSLLANFQILNLVPEKFHINFNNDDSHVIEDAVLYWRQVGKVLGRSAHLNTIVWPGGDLVASALSARTRSVFRIVTALAPPFVMEGALDEDGQCLRGVICHRVLNSDKDNLTLVFSEMETQERMEDEVEELGVDERTEKPFKFIEHNYFEYHSTKYKYKSSCCYGLAMDLLENVAQELEFEFHLYLVPDGAYGARSHVWEQGTPQFKWNGIVGDLVSGAAHMSFAALSVSKQRSQVIDFSTPYFFSGVSFLAAPTQKSEVPLLAFLLPFSTELWIAIFTSLNITAMAVACYEWLSPFGLNPWGRQRSRNFSIASALWVMWGLLCGHLVAFKAPKSWPNKFLINVWGGFSVIFVASYTANIAALIAGLFFHNSVSDYHDRSLLSQRVGAPKSSSADYYIHRANQHLWEHMQKYSFKDLDTGISLLRNGSLDILVADTPILDYYRATDHGCKLQKIVEAINEDTYAIGMNKGFPLKESISAVISKYSNNGYIDILTEKWYGGLPCFKMSPSVELTDVGQPRPLGVAAVAGVFLLLILGMIVGVLILILEHLFYRYTLPVLRHQPKGTIWRSRNIMFFSQKLYRFINCVELVSPHHAARELVHTLRQGQITSLFQKSVKRKEHEQRRRRKSKAQFFEMIQEIRRVQQEGKEEPKVGKEAAAGGNAEGSSPKPQTRGFLTSPRSLKHFRSSKSSVSPQMTVDVADPLNPADLIQQRRSSKTPSRLDIRRFSKELFSLPRSPKSPKMKSPTTLDAGKASSDAEESRSRNDLKNCRTAEIRPSAKDIRVETSKAIGRRLSKDSSSWLTGSPPDLNFRRKSHQDADHGKSSTVFEGASSLVETLKSTSHSSDTTCGDKEKELSKSLSLPPVISKAATLRLASTGSLETGTAVKMRPRLPSPPRSPVLELRTPRTPKINVSRADSFNVYDTIASKEETVSKRIPKQSHSRSRSLDNKLLTFETSVVNIDGDILDREKVVASHTVNYATLEHRKRDCEDERASKVSGRESANHNIKVKNSTGSRDREPGRQDVKNHEPKSPGGKRLAFVSSDPKTPCAKQQAREGERDGEWPRAADEVHPLYAEPQKLKKERRADEPTAQHPASKPKVPPKNNSLLKMKQGRACSAPETGRTEPKGIPAFADHERSPRKPTHPNAQPCIEYNYYSEQRKFQKSGSFPEQGRDSRCADECWLEPRGGHRRAEAVRSPKRQACEFVRENRPERRAHPPASRRSRSVPEHRFSTVCGDHDDVARGGKAKCETPILVLQLLRSPPRTPGILKTRTARSRSRDEIEVVPAPTSPSERRRRLEVAKRDALPLRKPMSSHGEPP